MSLFKPGLKRLVNQRRLVAIVLLAVSLNPTAEAGCVQSIRELIKQKLGLSSSTEKQQFSRIDPLVKKWIDSANPSLSKIMPKHVGDSLQFNSRNYPIAALLGQGYEANVYLVDSEEGFRVIKVFKNTDPESISFHVRLLKEMRQAGIDTPDIIAVNKGSIMFNYIEGISVNNIVNNWKALGIDEKVVKNIVERLKIAKLSWNSRLSSSATLSGNVKLVDSNVIYSFKNKKFYLIDPY